LDAARAGQPYFAKYHARRAVTNTPVATSANLAARRVCRLAEQCQAGHAAMAEHREASLRAGLEHFGIAQG